MEEEFDYSHQLIVNFKLPNEFPTPEEMDKLFEAEEAVGEALDEKIGFVDGNDIGMGEYQMFVLINDPDKNIEIVKDLVRKHDLPFPKKCILRDFSDEDEEEVELPF